MSELKLSPKDIEEITAKNISFNNSCPGGKGLAARLRAQRGWHIIRWEDRWGYGVIKSAKAVAEATPTAQELADRINERLSKV